MVFLSLFKIITWLTNRDRFIKTLLCQFSHFFYFFGFWWSIKNGKIIVSMITIIINCHIDINFIALIKWPQRWNPVNNTLVYRNTNRLWKIHKPNCCWIGPLFYCYIEYKSVYLFFC